MKRALATVAGTIAGFLVAGLIAPAMVVLLPARLRGGTLTLGMAATVVVVGGVAAWVASARQ